MSELEQYYDNFRASYWADVEPARCGCRGTGYALSQVDTWHPCPVHFTPGQRHPEDDGPDECDTVTVDARTVAALAAVTPAEVNEDDIPF